MLSEEDKTTETISLSTAESDEGLLARLGYKQELKRHFKPLEIFGFAFGLIGIVPSFSSVLIFSIPNGGAFAMVWGWTVCSIFIATITLAIGDIASAAPTSGGLYYWTFMFSLEKWRGFLCWIVGYSNTISNVASNTSISWGCAIQIMAAVSIGSDLKFRATMPQTFGLYCALILGHCLICTLNSSIMARLQTAVVIINVLLFCVVIIGLPVATPEEFRNDAKFAFEDFTNVSGWPNGFAFILSFLTPLWGAGCYDAPVHMSEEAANASIAVPMTIICSIFSATVFGWAMNIALVFCMGQDYQSIIDSPIGQPMATILFNSFGKTGTLVVWSFVILTQFAMGTNQTMTASRSLPSLKTEVSRCPGSNAIGAIFLLSVTAQYLSFCIPLSARFLGGKRIKPGPFRLGPLSLPITAVAVAWMTFMAVVFMFPATPSPGVGNMNYAVVVQGGVLILAIVYFYFPKYGGRNWFTGPISTVEVPALQVENDVAEKE
ncbi:APC amino acid permease [Desarmillaria tabescens]|uniref:APC amino acid permease n=1 Tax=Armillaria tabescens TaxID=1929756 RepID=A0AA39TM27_ARMTA|nr:APC amino acid permease [Desarmillaria tabescens]KAK0463782.1 APC amino acid permease [Desarmillaria tabescens]